MKSPKKLTNDTLAISLELWALLNKDSLTKEQCSYFEEIAWRLKLLPDMEEENINE